MDNYNHLTEDERYQMDELRREGLGPTAIAAALGRSPSTISRELRRNVGERGWRPRQAHGKARGRLSERGAGNVRRVSETAWESALEKLIGAQWSPEQIAGRMKLMGLGAISHETIYTRIYDDKKAGGSLHTHLRCRKQRKKRYGSGRDRRGQIVGRVGIEERPQIVDDRKRVGDWEGDTIIGKGHSQALVSMVERKSRYVCLAKVPNKSAEAVTAAIHAEMKPLSTLVHTVTLDNGKEFAEHAVWGETLNAKVYFARPYHSWERGLNENTNGLVRQYFPKAMRFHEITAEDVRAVADKLNHRPRKCLGYQTPHEVFSKACLQRGVALRI